MLHELAERVSLWLDADRKVVLVRAVETWGFGSRHTDEVLLVDDTGDIAGRVGGTSASGRIRDELGATMLGHEPSGAQFVTADVSRVEAAGEGLTCGGAVRALAQRIDTAPPLLWEALKRREPVVLVATASEGLEPPPWAVITSDSVAGDLDAFGSESDVAALAVELLAAGTAARRVVDLDGVELLVELFAPTPRLLIVGLGELSEALDHQGRLLGWDVTASDELDDVLRQLSPLGPGDALVVLSHDAALDVPVITGAWARRLGYIGALGSRRTQQARRDRLIDSGATDGQVDGIFGPVGLDLGARTPAETALSVFAEIVAHRSHRDAAPLRSHQGPIHLQTAADQI